MTVGIFFQWFKVWKSYIEKLHHGKAALTGWVSENAAMYKGVYVMS